MPAWMRMLAHVTMYDKHGVTYWSTKEHTKVMCSCGRSWLINR